MNYANTHKDIVEACRSGKRSAQYALYQKYSAAMYNICLRMLRHELDAEDVLQTSFMDVFAKLDTFRYDASIGSWIKRIVVNNCINFLKKKRLDLAELQDSHHPIVEEKAEADLPYDIQQIQEAIYQLPDGYRVVFNLYLMEGYDHQEIGEILGVSETTSKSQYSRAKKKLRRLLSEESRGHIL
ncbi:MAG: RNA polymerase sigma factor (sigma-70 family) [Polaribacter sp.]